MSCGIFFEVLIGFRRIQICLRSAYGLHPCYNANSRESSNRQRTMVHLREPCRGRHGESPGVSVFQQIRLPPYCNVGDFLTRVAAEAPDRAAVIWTARRFGERASYADISFASLDELSRQYAAGLAAEGIIAGMKTLVMVRPGVDFIAVMYALFRLGAVPVLIDPGMGIGRLFECVRTVDVEAFVGIPAAHVARLLKRSAMPRLKCLVTAGRKWGWGGATLREFREKPSSSCDPCKTRANDLAAILFTSGSTGPAKGVAYEHGMFDAQIRAIQQHFGIQPGEVDLPGFAPFGLFSIAMGMTTVIPDMNPSRPAKVDPRRFVSAIQDHRVTNSFGSPAIWNRVSRYCLERGIKLTSLRRVLMAGAPVSWRLVEAVKRILNEDADVHTPYGATEAMPVSSISGREILNGYGAKARQGAGTCVGESLSLLDVTVVPLTDAPLPEWSDDLLVPDGEIGEIAVAGPMVTREYWSMPDATRGSKIYEGDTIWHRMGDVGYRDADGRIWYCGRKSHCVRTRGGVLYTDPIESIFNEHPDVNRTALVGVGPSGDARPVLIVEPQAGRFPRGPRAEEFREELLRIGQANPVSRPVTHFLFHKSLPVDVRHNIKINREALAQWAAKRLR